MRQTLRCERQYLSHRSCPVAVESELKKFNTLNTISFFINNYILTYFWAMGVLLQHKSCTCFIYSKYIVKSSSRICNFLLSLISPVRYQSLDFTYDRWYDIYLMWTLSRYMLSLLWLAYTFHVVSSFSSILCKHITSPVRKFRDHGGTATRDVHGYEIFRTVRVRFEIPAFEPVRTCSKQVRTGE